MGSLTGARQQMDDRHLLQSARTQGNLATTLHLAVMEMVRYLNAGRHYGPGPNGDDFGNQWKRQLKLAL